MTPSTFEQEVRSRLHDALGDGPEPRPSWDDVARRVERGQRRRRQRRLVVSAAAVVVVLVAGLLAWPRPSSEPRVDTRPAGPVESEPSTTAPVAPTTSNPVPADDQLKAVSTTPVGVGADLVADASGAWLVEPSGSSMALVHVDLRGRKTSTTLPGVSQGPVWLASGQGWVWALSWSTDTLFRIDPRTRAVSKSVVVPKRNAGTEPEGLAVGLGSVWVPVCCDGAAPNQRLLRIDPATLSVQGQVALPGDGESERVVVGAAELYVTGEGFDAVAVVDPVRAGVVRQVTVAGGAGPVAVGQQVFVSSGRALFTIDPAALVAQQVGVWPTAVDQLAASGGSLFAVAATGPGTAPVTAPAYELVGGEFRIVPDSAGATTVAASGDRVWFLRAGQLVQLARG